MHLQKKNVPIKFKLKPWEAFSHYGCCAITVTVQVYFRQHPGSWRHSWSQTHGVLIPSREGCFHGPMTALSKGLDFFLYWYVHKYIYPKDPRKLTGGVKKLTLVRLLWLKWVFLTPPVNPCGFLGYWGVVHLYIFFTF